MKYKGLKYLGIRYVLTVVTIFILSQLIQSIKVESSLLLLYFGVVYIIIGLILRPILMVIGFPLSVLTFGLFLLIINAILLLIAGWMTPNIHIGGFLNAILISAVVTVGKAVVKRIDSSRNMQLHSK